MKVRIVFDKEGVNERFKSGIGFSALIGENILFDTGENWDYLYNNLTLLGRNISKIKKAVISHDHWDHTRGLWGLLKRNKGTKVYICPGFTKDFKKQASVLKGAQKENSSFFEIKKDVYVTGEINGRYNNSKMPEQALVLDTKKGVSVITGCAHPGIIKMLRIVKKQFKRKSFYAVLGGFHLLHKRTSDVRDIIKEFKALGVKKAGPSHCTGREAEKMFWQAYRENFIPVKSGSTFVL